MKKLVLYLNLSFALLNISMSQVSEFKILPEDGNSENLFGYALSISEDFAIVGAPFSNDSAGAAYVFEWDGLSWNESQKLVASDGLKGDWFGGYLSSISLSGDYAIIGAPYADSSKGSVYIYKREGTSWIEYQKLNANDGVQGDWFGISVSMYGDYAIVGSPRKNNYAGSAYVFKKENGNWIEQQNLSNNSDDVLFGIAVSISEDYLIVGASYLRGSAYLYKREGNTWVEEQKLTSIGEDSLNNRFGFSVSISGDCAVVGAFGSLVKGNYTGAAYIFRREGINWIEEQKIFASDGSQGDYFGVSVSISSGYIVVGAPWDDDAGVNSGSAYIFSKEGSSWIEKQKLTANDADSDDIFGVSVSITGNKAIIGAPGNDDNSENSGSAYIYNGFIVDVENHESVNPLTFSLRQNFPNPFNPSTTIRYSLPQSSNVVIKVYDVLGNKVATLVDEYKIIGTYEVEWDASGLPSGVYFYQLKTNDFIETKKMLLIK